MIRVSYPEECRKALGHILSMKGNSGKRVVYDGHFSTKFIDLHLVVIHPNL